MAVNIKENSGIAFPITVTRDELMGEQKMYHDPIGEEVRESGRKFASRVGGDRKRFIEKLRENQRKSTRKVVSFAKKKK